ncbi:hypothetical protein FGG08_001983 [Glutinoglossum americanum]|uniref:Nuclear pore protein n=1 Tax=Glutinoglossum americanum TaxID=1670608 RepID=A0A9P8IA48_9PEZI|nr:hypothetical protein FGG08_001983 [Glutinoglossum americanum]
MFPQPSKTGSSWGASAFTQSTQGQQSGASPFAGFGQPPKPQTSSPFAGFGLSQQPQQQQQQPPTQGGSRFVGFVPTAQLTQPQPLSTQAQQPGLFGAQQQPQQSQQQPQQSQQQSSSQPAFFDSLLERSRQRNKDINGSSTLEELPSLQLGLGDIARRVRQLGGPTASQQGRGVDSKAHYILAASGISPGTALKDLDELNAHAATAAPPAPSKSTIDTDIDSYLSKLQSQSTLALIANGLSRSAQDFDAFLEKNVTMEWDAQRRRIYEHFGLVPRNAEGRDTDDINASGGSSARGGFGRSTRRGRTQDRGGMGRSTTPTGGSVFGAPSLSKSVIGAPTTAGIGHVPLFTDVAEKAAGAGLSGGLGGPDDRFLREKQTRFAETVGRLNEARLEGRASPILREFASVESQSSADQTTSQLVDAYKALSEIVKENPNAVNATDPDNIRERQFAADYLEESPNSARSVAIKKRIIDGSRSFLEKRRVTRFYRQIEALIAKNPREARVGGVPSNINKIRAYINLRNSQRDLIPENGTLQMLGSDYVWVLIFYLLRTGHLKEAAEYVTGNHSSFRNIDRNFVTYITSYANDGNRRLTRDLQDRINAEYTQRQRIAPEDSIDPYRMACYKVIGRCDLSKRSLEGVSQGVEDWIWLQFSLAREVNRVDEVAGEVFGLDEVREVIKEIGQRHFVKGQEAASGGYGTYFFLQILAGMFEQAVAYLYPYQYIDAVHFGIALDFYGLLRVSDSHASDSELLSFTTSDLPRINFGRMLGYYTRDFRAGNVEAAVDYITLICLNADLPGQSGKSQASLCHSALRELVLETREFAKLLGDIRADGIRIGGAIERRLKLIKLTDQEEFLHTVTTQAAKVADDNGRTTDAVLLYHLAEEYDNVIAIINKTLSEAIAIDIGQEQLKLQPLKPRAGPDQQQRENSQPGSSLSLTSVDDPAVLARNMIGLYNGNAMYFRKIRQANRDACGILLRMSEAKALVEVGQWTPALDIISSLNILPLSANSDVYQIRSSAHAFSGLHPSVARNVGNLLMWTITCCGRQRDLLRASQFDVGTRKVMADELLGKAKDLMVYAGMIKYKLPPNVYEALASAGQEVGAY